MKGKFLTLGLAGMAIVSCSNHDFDLERYAAEKHEAKIRQYTQAFINTFGEPAAGHTWGFGSVGTRAANTWTDNHSDDWFDKVNFSLPSSYVTLTASDNTLRSGNVYYVPADFSGTINFDNFNGDVYVAAEITNFWGNPGNVNVYVLKGGAWKKGTTAGSLTIYNQGTVELGPWDLQTASNIPVIYNGGTLKIGNTDNNANIADAVKIYSTTDVTIYGKSNSGQYEAIDLKCSLDIHGTINVPTGNLKIQNSKTQHVCGLNVAGTLDVTQGKLESSYITADYIKFDGASIWLTEGGHIKANTIYMPNSATYIYGETGSVGLIEVTDITMGNQNFFDKVFSSNIYFKIAGNIKFENSSVWDGTWTASKYVTDTEDGKTVAKRMNAGDAKGNPACGTEWTVGTPTTPDPETPTEPEPTNDGLFQIWCEDLGAEYGVNSNDFDFNDVVISFKKDASGNRTEMWLDAAGATLPIEIYWDGTLLGEVHQLFEVNEKTMVNTGAGANVDPYPLATVMGIVSPEEAADRLTIQVKEGETGVYYILKNGSATAPQMIVCEYGLPWSREYIRIDTTYPSFVNWVGDKANVGAKFANKK